MNWQDLLDPDIQNFIKEHKDANVQELALRKPPIAAWPYALIMDQIKARQKFSAKIPHANKDNMIFPPPDLVEQASSWACASYKASLVTGETFVDLTAGSGSDSFALSRNFKSGIAVERDPSSAQILAHNITILGIQALEVKNTSAEDYVETMPKAALAYIDPQRRNDKRRGIYDLSDCSPNIMALLPAIKAHNIIIKTSPVLDIKKTIADLSHVRQVHIVEYGGDCKEMLFVVSKECPPDTNPDIIAVTINENGQAANKLTFTLEQEQSASCEFSLPETYLYEPSPAYQKAGAYKTLANIYGLKKLHPNTHLYTGETIIQDFPGRSFRILDSVPASHKQLKAVLPDMKANLTIRNFPMSVNDLRKKLKLRDGGVFTLFACTNTDEQKIILKCEKI